MFSRNLYLRFFCCCCFLFLKADVFNWDFKNDDTITGNFNKDTLQPLRQKQEKSSEKYCNSVDSRFVKNMWWSCYLVTQFYMNLFSSFSFSYENYLTLWGDKFFTNVGTRRKTTANCVTLQLTCSWEHNGAKIVLNLNLCA